MFDQWGTPNVDLFATRYNKRLPVFVSPVPDSQALEIDALAIQWEGMSAYAFPPTKIINLVIRKLQDTADIRLILVAPMWPNQLWYPDLLEITSQEPIRLPNTKTLLKQPRSDVFHQAPENLRLHAWLVEKRN